MRLALILGLLTSVSCATAEPPYWLDPVVQGDHMEFQWIYPATVPLTEQSCEGAMVYWHNDLLFIDFACDGSDEYGKENLSYEMLPRADSLEGQGVVVSLKHIPPRAGFTLILRRKGETLGHYAYRRGA